MYRDNDIYIALEALIKRAGISIRYGEVPDDIVDGEIWARSDLDSMLIMMPDDADAFPDDETACLILGHEMGHFLSKLESLDDPIERVKNEAVCDLIGHYLYKLAEMIVSGDTEKQLNDAIQRAGGMNNGNG